MVPANTVSFSMMAPNRLKETSSFARVAITFVRTGEKGGSLSMESWMRLV
jgi:hypothetical protein